MRQAANVEMTSRFAAQSLKRAFPKGQSAQGRESGFRGPIRGFFHGDSQRAATEGRNPRTGETIKIAARKVPRFRAGKGLKDAIA